MFNNNIAIIKFDYNGFSADIRHLNLRYDWMDFIDYKIEKIGDIFNNYEIIQKAKYEIARKNLY